MKNKKIVTLALLAILVVSPLAVSAKTVDAGIKPGSFFYIFDKAFENIGMFFTFSSEKKAQKAIDHAEERLAEMKAVVGTDDSGEINEVAKNYEESILRATEETSEVKDKEKADKLFSTITNNYSRHKDTLEKVLEQVPEQAKESIKKVIEKSQERYKKAIEKIDELKGENEKLREEIKEMRRKLQEGKEENNNKEVEEKDEKEELNEENEEKVEKKEDEKDEKEEKEEKNELDEDNELEEKERHEDKEDKEKESENNNEISN